jgi:hypothetical protein
VSSGQFNSSFYAERIGQPAIGDLFDPRFMARASDPETSKEAARSMRESAATECAKVLDGLTRAGGKAGAEQIGELCGLAAYVVRKRTPILERAGKVRRTGETRTTSTGKPEQVWSLA